MHSVGKWNKLCAGPPHEKVYVRGITSSARGTRVAHLVNAMRSVLLTLLLASCSLGDPSAPDAGVADTRLELLLRPSGEPIPLTLQTAVASFEEIRFVGDADEDVDAGAASLDLAAAEPPAIVVIDPAPGLYSRVRLRLGPDEAATLSIDGLFSGTPVEFRAHEEDEIDLRCPEGQRLDPGGRVTLLVDVDRSRWLSGVDLGDAEVEDGVLRLDPDDGPNREIAEQVFEQILGSFSIHGAPGQGEPAEDGGIEDGDIGDAPEDGEDD